LYHSGLALDWVDGQNFTRWLSVGTTSSTSNTLTMHEVSFEEALKRIQAKDNRYDREAYTFVREALDQTQRNIARERRGKMRHISGQELLSGIRDHALAQFGPMTMDLFQEWGIRCCEDFGEIVFNMVEAGWLAKTEKDSRADFAGGYDFFETFRKPFLPPSKQVQKEVRRQSSPKVKL